MTAAVAHVTVVRCDDWQGIYINGTMHYQHHHVEVRDALDAVIGKTVVAFDQFWVEDQWVEDQGEFPNNLNDIPQEARTS